MSSAEADADALPHVLVIDDDGRIRSLLQRYLAQNGFRVTTAKDAVDARAKMGGLDFDLLVLDVMMPGESGVDFARSLRGGNDVPILMLTARGEVHDRLDGLESGVDDYLTKPFEPRELVLRIRSILKRAHTPAREHEPIRMGPCRFDPVRGELTRHGKAVRLTSSEVTLLKLFTAHAGKPLSRTEITELSGASLERSVDVQINRLRRKIESDPKMPVYLQTVRGVGYALIPDIG
jgi:two-component system, OmpR family, phosphate regulon response regulator OmpR